MLTQAFSTEAEGMTTDNSCFPMMYVEETRCYSKTDSDLFGLLRLVFSKLADDKNYESIAIKCARAQVSVLTSLLIMFWINSKIILLVVLLQPVLSQPSVQLGSTTIVGLAPQSIPLLEYFQGIRVAEQIRQ